MVKKRSPRHPLWLLPIVALAFVMAVSLAFAEAPVPNPLSGGSTFGADLKYLDIMANGPAATIHGDPAAGRAIYGQYCASCHGPRGTGGVENPGSDDGTVPPLNPVDPGFAGDTPGDPAVFAKNLDLFIQHGSTPSGPNPQISMPGWGDVRRLTQQQVADAEAYIMQLNGVYWPDRWSPPLEVQGQARRDGNTITYQFMLVNQGNSDLTSLVLRDTLPPGMTYVTSYVPGPGQNPGVWNGTTLKWEHGSGVPQGGTLGPFVIVAQVQGPNVPPNIAQAEFKWTALDNRQYSTTAVSAPVSPAAPPTSTARPAQAAQPVRPAATQAAAAAPKAASATLVPTVAATSVAAAPATAAPTQSPTSVPAATTSAPVATAAPTATVAPTTAPAAPAGDAAAGAQVFQTKGCTTCHAVNGTGGSVGPDLSHIGSQPYDGMANDPAFLTRWIQNPKAIKPDTIMPHVDMTDTELNNLVAYLVSLK